MERTLWISKARKNRGPDFWSTRLKPICALLVWSCIWFLSANWKSDFTYINIPLLTEPYARRHISKDDRSHFDLADQLQDLHATILEKLDNLEVMRGHLREEYVPSNVCQNLEQCLKDSEVGIEYHCIEFFIWDCIYFFTAFGSIYTETFLIKLIRRIN